MLGITGYDLVEQDHAYKQLDLFSFEKDAKKEPLNKTLSSLREKYGKNIIENAGAHKDRSLIEILALGQVSTRTFFARFLNKKRRRLKKLALCVKQCGAFSSFICIYQLLNL